MQESDTWRLAPSAALRPEPFGALAYDFASRRLTFLKTPTLVDVVRSLADHRTVGAALDAAEVTAEERPAYLRALDRLGATGLIVHARAGSPP